MPDYHHGTFRIRPVSRGKHGTSTGARAYRGIRLKTELQCHRCLLRPAGRADDYPRRFRQFGFKPIRHTPCLIQSFPGQLARHIGKTLFRFGMTPQNQFHRYFLEVLKLERLNVMCQNCIIKISMPAIKAALNFLLM
jgi:hypothetical protein